MSKNTNEKLLEKLKRVEARPGVYLFKGAGEKVLYVGKAKNLRIRLRSYFRKSANLDQRKTVMVRKVQGFDTIVTGNELEALALEANLIKQYHPKFNVTLRDDKNYPYLRIDTKEEWPRLQVVRRTKKDKATYFGPYVPSGTMYEAMTFIKKNFGLRPCKYKFERDMKPIRPCIQFQMGRCPAPCAGLIKREDYMKTVYDVVQFLKGKRMELLDGLRERMAEQSEAMEYEEAAKVRDRIRALERAWESQKVVAPELGDLDVIGFHAEGDIAVAQVFFVRNGVMIGAKDFVLKDMEGVVREELIEGFLLMFYAKDTIPPAEILLGAEPDGMETLEAWLTQKGRRVNLKVPKRGKRFELLRMAEDNARVIYKSRKGEGVAIGEMLEELGTRLGLDEPPSSIGAFDISNLTGTDPVGAFVYWEDGDFSKDKYRHMRIKNVEGIDDYAMMREVVTRVFADMEPPDLVVIDGGKGHLQAAREAAKEVAPGAFLSALAKKPDRLFLAERAEPLELSDRSESSRLLKRIRDEVHRFAITYHKKLRSKRTMESPLKSIPGIGKKRHLALLRAFGSLEGIREATVEVLAAVDGMNTKAAQAVMDAFSED
jgi:excinuclease ABC subunit C